MDPLPQLLHPPRIAQTQFAHLVDHVKDWQINNGSLVKLVGTNEVNTVLSRPIGAALFPSLWPRSCFEQAQKLQSIFNELYAAIAADEEWLSQVLSDFIRVDKIAGALWDIHLAVKKSGYAQDITLGLFRSDYMLHTEPNIASKEIQAPLLKQVEINTYSCAGGSHATKVSSMHNYLAMSGAYTSSSQLLNFISPQSLPRCNTVKSLADGLAAAHQAYGRPRRAVPTAVLFVVQPQNVNVCDERPIEYALWDRDPPIPAYRVIFGQDVLDSTTLTDSRDLLFQPDPSKTAVEISVVYQRAGYDEAEFSDIGVAARLRLERSRAIKCPSVLSHLSNFKKVQQALAVPDTLSRFLSPEKAALVASTFAPLYPLDNSELGLRARKLACDPRTAPNYVLKPSLEGGGHNIYGGDIPDFLAATPEDLWCSFILMEMIRPPTLHNVLLSPMELYDGPIISELGIFGVCLWRQNSNESLQKSELLMNLEGSFSLKTKAEDIDEMSVIKGYGCFDSPCLVDDEPFREAMRSSRAFEESEERQTWF